MMRDDNYQPYILIGPDHKQQIEARLLTLRRLRTRTKPLERSQRRKRATTCLQFIGGWLVLLVLIAVVLATLAGAINWR